MLTVRPAAPRLPIAPDTAERLASLALVAGFLLAGMLVREPQLLRAGFAAALLAVVLALALRSPQTLLLGVVAWLAGLGLGRRLLSSLGAEAGAADPLLLVAPAALVLVAVVAVDRGAMRPRTGLSAAVMALTGLVVLGALNPLQGSLLAGLSALIFFVPLLAFWIGRALSDEDLKRVLLIVGLLAVPAAGYGLFQTFSGFPSWDRRWIDTNGYEALNVRGATRPFSVFSSGAEYSTYLAIGVVAWLTLVRARAALVLRLAVVALLVAGAVLQASRGAVVMLVFGAALVLAARRRLAGPVAVLLAAGTIGLLPVAVAQLAPAAEGDSSAASLLGHFVDGLSDPFNPEASTAQVHLSLAVGGVRSILDRPFGHGISTVTIAGSKFGGYNHNTEADPSNASVALGLPGLMAYGLVFALGIAGAYRLAASTGAVLPAAALGVLGVSAFQWLNGGKYAVAFLPWLVLGWVDRKRLEGRRLR